MSEVLPQNDADEFPAILTGAAAAGFFDAGVFDGDADGEADGEGDAEGGRETGAGAGEATKDATGAACGVRADGAQPATAATTDTAQRLNTRRRTRAACRAKTPRST
jgi:hypothetical protein